MKKLLQLMALETLILLLCLSAQAQTPIPVNGRVVDAGNQQPLIGVTVRQAGTANAVATDVNGNFTINVPGNATLTVSYIGYETLEVPVNNETQLMISLGISTQQLDQVVVVGYGTQRRRDVTGSIVSVSGQELAQQPVQTPTQAMQGKVSGVQVIASGAPNAQPQVRVRGTGSALAGVEPLYVVDGVLTNDIRNINTADIVSMEVLKDASSAAIYGVRAANGVIIVTTRRGQEGEPQVSYNADAGFRQAANVVEMANTDQYRGYMQDVSPGTQLPAAPGDTRWFDAILRNAFYSSHSLSVSGGTERTTYFISGGYFTDNGIMQNNSFRRFTFRANNEVNITDRLRFSNQLSLTRARTQDVPVGSAFNNAYRAAPVVPAKANGRYGNTSAFGNVGNPLLDIEQTDNQLNENRLQGNIALDYNPWDFIRLHSAFNTDVFFNNRRIYNYRFLNDERTFITAGGNQQRLNSQLIAEENRSTRWIWDNTATFERTFEDHGITFLVGSVTEQLNGNFLTGSRINVPATPAQWYLVQGNPDVQSTNNSGGNIETRQSFISRINYNYGHRYLLTASFRADGNSKFRERWAYFPTVGLGWVLSEENFLQGQNVLDYLKLRGSWGLLGNDAIDPNQYIVTAATNIPYFFNNAITLGSAIQEIKDQNLRWEKTEQFDMGLEFITLDNRLTGEIDFYDKRTIDALVRVNIPGILGDPDNSYITNAGSFRNRGVELALNWDQPVNDNFRYNIGGNVTFNRNEIIGLQLGEALPGGGVGQQGFVTLSASGQPVGSFFVLRHTGVFQTQQEIDASAQPNAQPGDLRYEDVTNDGVINNDDRVFVGSHQPRMYYGITGGVTFGNIDLAAIFYGNAGNYVYNGKRAFRFQPTDNIEADFARNRWTPTNPSQTDPRTVQANTPASTYFVEPGDFFRLNNLTIGYTFPELRMGNANISSLRLFATGQNLFTLQRFSGFNPELPGGSPLDAGIELGVYPITRTIAFGVNLTF